MGRFTSPDSVGGNPDSPQSWNLYSYVLNSPLTNSDPDGHDVMVCDGTGGQCTTISNEDYAAAQRAGNTGLNVPTLDQVGSNGDGSGHFNSTAITDSNGNTVGTATYVSDGGADYYANANGYKQVANASRVVGAGTAVYAGIYGGAAAVAVGPGAAAAVGRWGLQRLAMGASSPALLNLINRLYQAQDELPGGTAGAVRNEVSTGEYITYLSGHAEKAATTIRALEKLINSG